MCILQSRAGYACGKFPLLMHADRSIRSVVEDNEQHPDTVLNRRGQFLAIHQEVAVAGHIEHAALLAAMLFDDAGGDSGRYAVAHCAGRRRELRPQSPVGPETMRPSGVVAGAVGDDGVGG